MSDTQHQLRECGPLGHAWSDAGGAWVCSRCGATTAANARPKRLGDPMPARLVAADNLLRAVLAAPNCCQQGPYGSRCAQCRALAEAVVEYRNVVGD